MFVKRLFDIVVSFLGLILLAPVFLVVGLAVIFLSGWPVFFVQLRVGKEGADFLIFKFRTMTPVPEKKDGFDPGNTMRVTGIGRFLRKTKLDELPQLWNVVKGDMSLVGPRPEVRKWVDTNRERWQVILSIRPGITDPASVTFRDEEQILAQAEDPETMYRDVVLPRKMDLYGDYVLTRSFIGDIKILLKTFGVILKPRKVS
jgi:lipopolysaccharide/colanic/teichoic acid biosynthesis glycosyltransferase